MCFGPPTLEGSSKLTFLKRSGAKRSVPLSIDVPALGDQREGRVGEVPTEEATLGRGSLEAMGVHSVAGQTEVHLG